MRHLAGSTAQGHFSKKTEEKTTSSKYFNAVASDLTYKDLNDRVNLDALNAWEHAAIGHRDGGQQNFRTLKDTLRSFFESNDRTLEVNYMKNIYDNYIAEAGSHHHLGQIPAVKMLIYTVFMSKVEELRHEVRGNKQHVKLKDELKEYFKPPLEEIVTSIGNQLREVEADLQAVRDNNPGFNMLTRVLGILAQTPETTPLIQEAANSPKNERLPTYSQANQLDAPPSYSTADAFPPDYNDAGLNQDYKTARSALEKLSTVDIGFELPKLPAPTASNEEHASFLNKLTQHVQDNLDKINPRLVLNQLCRLLPALDVTNVRERVELLGSLKDAAMSLPDETPLKATLSNLSEMTRLSELQAHKQELERYLDTNFSQLNLDQLGGLRSYLVEGKQQELDKYGTIINRWSDNYYNLSTAGGKVQLKEESKQNLLTKYKGNIVPLKNTANNLNDTLLGINQVPFTDAKEDVDKLLNEFDEAYNTHLPDYMFELESIAKPATTRDNLDYHKTMVSRFFVSIARQALGKSDADIIQTLKNTIETRPENNVESKHSTKAKLEELNVKQQQLLAECQTKLIPCLNKETKRLLNKIEDIRSAVNDLVIILPKVNNNSDEEVVFLKQLDTIQQTLQNFTYNDANELQYDQITKNLDNIIKSLNNALPKSTTEVSILEMKHKPTAEDFESNQIIIYGKMAYFKHVDTNQVECLNDKSLSRFPIHQQFNSDSLAKYITDKNNRKELIDAGVISRSFSSSITNLNDIIKSLGVIVTNEAIEIQGVLKQHNELASLLGAFATELTNHKAIKIENLRKIDDLVNKTFSSNISIKESIRKFVATHLQYSTLSQLNVEQRQSFDRLNSLPTTAENIDKQIAGLCDIYSQQVVLNSLVNTGDPDLTHRNLMEYARENVTNSTLNAYKENYNRAASLINNSVTHINNELTRSQFDESTTKSIVSILSALTSATQEQAKSAGIGLSAIQEYDIKAHVKASESKINATQIIKSLYYNFTLSHHISDKVKDITKRLFTGVEYFGQSKDFQPAVSALNSHATGKISRRSKIGSISISERTKSDVTIPKFDPNRSELPKDIADIVAGQEKLKEARSRLSSTPNIFANPDKGLADLTVPEQIKVPEPEVLDENSQVVNNLLLSFVVSAPNLDAIIRFAEGHKLPTKDLPSSIHGTTVIQIVDNWCGKLAEFKEYNDAKMDEKTQKVNDPVIVKDFWELSRKVFNLLITIRTMMAWDSSSSESQSNLDVVLRELWKPTTYVPEVKLLKPETYVNLADKVRNAISPKGQTGKTEFYYVFAALFGESLYWVQANLDGAIKSVADNKVKSASRQDQIRNFTAEMLKNQPNDVAKHYADLTTLISFDPNRGAGFNSIPII